MNEELEDRHRVAHWTFTEHRVAHWGAALLCIITSQGITRVETPHTDLGHVLCDDVEAAPLLHDHPQQLHQVVVPQLPSSNTSGGEKSIQLSLAQQQLLLWSLQHVLHVALSHRGVCGGGGGGFLRHDRGLRDERLRRGVVFDTLDRHLGPSVVSHHHI